MHSFYSRNLNYKCNNALCFVTTGDYEDLSSSEIATRVSESSFVTLYLIFTFTTIIKLFTQLSSIAGYTSRVAHLIEEMTRIHEEQEQQTMKTEYFATSSLYSLTSLKHYH